MGENGQTKSMKATAKREAAARPNSAANETSMAIGPALDLTSFTALAPSGAHVVNIGDTLLDSKGNARKSKKDGSVLRSQSVRYSLPTIKELRERPENKGKSDEQLEAIQTECGKAMKHTAAQMQAAANGSDKAICSRIAMSQTAFSTGYKIVGVFFGGRGGMGTDRPYSVCYRAG